MTTATATTDIAADTLTNADVMEILRSDAGSYRPRMFAIYGIYKKVGEFLPEQPFLGWGIEVDPDNGYGGAVFFDPCNRDTYHASSTEAVLKSFRRLGEAHLVWLDTEDS